MTADPVILTQCTDEYLQAIPYGVIVLREESDGPAAFIHPVYMQDLMQSMRLDAWEFAEYLTELAERETAKAVLARAEAILTAKPAH